MFLDLADSFTWIEVLVFSCFEKRYVGRITFHSQFKFSCSLGAWHLDWTCYDGVSLPYIVFIAASNGACRVNYILAVPMPKFTFRHSTKLFVNWFCLRREQFEWFGSIEESLQRPEQILGQGTSGETGAGTEKQAVRNRNTRVDQVSSLLQLP